MDFVKAVISKLDQSRIEIKKDRDGTLISEVVPLEPTAEIGQKLTEESV